MLLILGTAAGCATTKVMESGPAGPSPLVTVEHATPERVEEFCGSPDARGCALTHQGPDKIWRTRIIARIGLTAEETAHLMGHETCHAMAAVNVASGALDRDPCHDGGAGEVARSTHEERVRRVMR